jgi:intracellular sulfur oxidation DsrE/DsrF family protein
MKNLAAFYLIGLFLSMTTEVHAATAKKGPVFSDYGAVYEISDLTVPLTKDFRYKVLFDISKGPESEDELNRNIDSVARFINMHVKQGVKLENIDIAVVLHGKATLAGLSHEAYDERYLVKNPTLDLIDKLHAKGVKFYQCGQSAYYQNIKTKDLSPNVGMALSAMTMLTELQTQGYRLIPWW